MTPRERLLKILHDEITDCVPCCPDISNMVPCRLIGKPFWDIYVYHNPPLWKAHIDAVKYFNIDGGFELYDFGDLFGDNPKTESRIVHRYPDGSFVTQSFDLTTGKWSPRVEVNTADNPPARHVDPIKLELPAVPATWEPITRLKSWPTGMELWQLIRSELGDHGAIGMASGGDTLVLENPEDIYAYYDNPELFYAKRDRRLETIEKRMAIITQLEIKPDFLFCGNSGSLVFQSPAIFRELALPILKKATEMASAIGIPTYMHSCGPEKALVKMAAEETSLTIIDPLEIPPMGDCNLAELKRLYGSKLVLKGNLHTTDVMLRGTVEDVIATSRKAIDDAAKGGRFILSTGDQCGRDTPDENLFAMVATARTYGRY